MGNNYSYDVNKITDYTNEKLVACHKYVIKNCIINLTLLDVYLHEIKKRFGTVDIEYDEDGHTLIYLIIWHIEPERTHLILEHVFDNYEIDINKSVMFNGSNMFPYLVKLNQTINTYQILIEQGININGFIPDRQHTALDEAYEQLDDKLYSYLCDKGVVTYKQLSTYGTQNIC